MNKSGVRSSTFEAACHARHLELFARAGQGASAMEQVSGQSQQFLERSIGEVLRFVQLVWTWSSDQIIRVTQAPWEHWPLWKQMLLLIVAAAVVYFLFIAAMQLWTAAINVLAAVATFIGTVIVTL